MDDLRDPLKYIRRNFAKGGDFSTDEGKHKKCMATTAYSTPKRCRWRVKESLEKLDVDWIIKQLNRDSRHDPLRCGDLILRFARHACCKGHGSEIAAVAQEIQ